MQTEGRWKEIVIFHWAELLCSSVLLEVNLVKRYFGESCRHSAGLGWHKGSIHLPAFHGEDLGALSHGRQGFWRDFPTMGAVLCCARRLQT